MSGFFIVTNEVSIFKTLWDKSKHIYKLDVTYALSTYSLWFSQKKTNLENGLSSQISESKQWEKALLVFNLMFQYLKAEKLYVIITEKEKRKTRLEQNWEKTNQK